MSSARTLRWMLAAPALLLGAFVYWTLAIGLGAVSLSVLQGLDVEMSQALPLGEPMDAEGTGVFRDESSEPAIDAPAGDAETIPVDVVGSREYTPGATSF